MALPDPAQLAKSYTVKKGPQCRICALPKVERDWITDLRKHGMFFSGISQAVKEHMKREDIAAHVLSNHFRAGHGKPPVA